MQDFVVPDTAILEDGSDDLREAAFYTALAKPVTSLLSFGKDAKTIKGEPFGVRTGVLYMAPAKFSGYEVCHSRTKGCTAACLFTAGQGRFPNVKQGRLRRTYTFVHRPGEFLTRILVEIDKEKNKLGKGMLMAIRLNGTSDIAYEDYPVVDVDGTVYPHVFAARPDIQFYDYTKRIERIEKILTIPNYHVTYSRAETKANQANAVKALAMGVNVTVVFGKDLPDTWEGYRVVDGDETDIRFWDQGDEPVIIGLKAKGLARYDESGFVVDP
jgi:hypothetical protein